MYRNALFAFIVLSLCITLAACNKKSTTPCPATPPPVSFLKFRVLDRNTGKDLLFDSTTGNRLYIDSITGVQPCRNDSLMIGYDLYQIPSAQPPYKYGYCFWFVNARNPALSEAADCFNLYIWWNSHAVDKISWRYSVAESDPCQPQTIGDVYFNGNLVTPVWDNAYLYYPLLK